MEAARCGADSYRAYQEVHPFRGGRIFIAGVVVLLHKGGLDVAEKMVRSGEVTTSILGLAVEVGDLQCAVC